MSEGTDVNFRLRREELLGQMSLYTSCRIISCITKSQRCQNHRKYFDYGRLQMDYCRDRCVGKTKNLVTKTDSFLKHRTKNYFGEKVLHDQ